MRVIMLMAVIFFGCANAWADMIEIKGKGFLNGKILSETSESVQFKDAKGNEYTVKRSDVVFMERQDDPPPAKPWTQQAGGVWDKVTKKLPKAPAAASSRQKAASAAPSQTESSTLLGMSGMASQALDMAGQAQAQMQIQQAKINKAMREAEGGAYTDGAEGSSKDPSSPYYDASKGRFSGLSNE